MSAEGKPGLTIDDLAGRVGMTVRNLREWRTLGLLPPAEMRGRVGYYDETVVERVTAIQGLHAEGFSLELIRRMLGAAGEAGDDVMRLAQALRAPFQAGRPPVDRERWAADWGAEDPDADLARAAALGLVTEDADGELRFAAPQVEGIGRDLHELGLTARESLEAAAAIRGHADGLAELFEQLWLDHVWQPFLDAGSPESELPRLQAAVARLHRLGLDAVVAIFTIAMEDRVQRGIAREVQRAGGAPSGRQAA